MKSTCPPPQVILVGLELNQHGQAASHEQASSSWPVIFHGVLSLGSFAARVGPLRNSRPATSVHGRRKVVFIAESYDHARGDDKSIFNVFLVDTFCPVMLSDAKHLWLIAFAPR